MNLFFKRRQVRLHLNDKSLEGILIERPNGFYRLVNASVIAEADQTYPVEGEVWIPHEKVIFLQVLA